MKAETISKEKPGRNATFGHACGYVPDYLSWFNGVSWDGPESEASVTRVDRCIKTSCGLSAMGGHHGLRT